MRQTDKVTWRNNLKNIYIKLFWETKGVWKFKTFSDLTLESINVLNVDYAVSSSYDFNRPT